MKLTASNYYTSKNKYLTNSGCSLFDRDKEAFYKRYILGEKEKCNSTALTVGKAFDLLITGSEEDFNNCYELKTLKKDNPELFLEQKTTQKKLLNNTEYNDILGMYNSLKLVDKGVLLEELQSMDSQTILQQDSKISKQFVGLAGIPDFVRIENNTCYLYDLKTTRPFSPPKSYSITEEESLQTQYFFKCLNYGYFRQLAMYRMLLKLKYPNITEFVMKHIVCEKANGLNYPVHVFNFSNELIDVHLQKLKLIVSQIRVEKDYRPNPTRERFTPTDINNIDLTI